MTAATDADRPIIRKCGWRESEHLNATPVHQAIRFVPQTYDMIKPLANSSCGMILRMDSTLGQASLH